MRSDSLPVWVATAGGDREAAAGPGEDRESLVARVVGGGWEELTVGESWGAELDTVLDTEGLTLGEGGGAILDTEEGRVGGGKGGVRGREEMASLRAATWVSNSLTLSCRERPACEYLHLGPRKHVEEFQKRQRGGLCHE